MRLRWCKGTGGPALHSPAGATEGFTLIEIVIVLAIIAVLAGILAPTLTRYVADSKIRRAETDAQVIAGAIGAFYSDTGEFPVWVVGTATKRADAKVKALKSSDGDDPVVPGTGDGSDWPGITGTFVGDAGTTNVADTLDSQLMLNTPVYPITGARQWRGPYLETVKKDPWGTKYLVNVEFVWPANVNATKPTYVISAGPNKQLDTIYSQAGPAITVGTDDIVFRIK